MNCKRLSLAALLAISWNLCPGLHGQGADSSNRVLQLCGDYSDSGDLLEASVFSHSLNISIIRPSGEIVRITDRIPDDTSIPVPPTWSKAPPSSSIAPCEFVVSGLSDHGAVAVSTTSGILIELIDLSTGKLTHTVRVTQRFPIQFALHPIGFFENTVQLAVSQAHYLPTGEPEISTQLVSPDGSVTSLSRSVIGPQYSEVSQSSFDFRDGRVWFLCPPYSARIDRQPRCTLTSASLRGASGQSPEIPPPPDDRVIGSGQPELGFPSSDLAVILAAKRFWEYNFIDRSFRQLDIPETPHYIRWFEFPGPPKFSSDGCFAAVPVHMFHYPLFEEGQVPHGTKLAVVDMATLQILETVQPPDKENIVDFALHNDGRHLNVEANWGQGWRSFQIPSNEGSAGACTVGKTTTH